MVQREWQNEATFHLMRRVVQRHNALWRARLPGLTPVQFSVLLSISQLPEADQKTIAAAAAVEPSTMANLTARMETAGLVVRASDAFDGRRYCLGLTDAGRSRLRAAMPIVRSVRDDCLAGVSEVDGAHLRRILGAMADATDSPLTDFVNQGNGNKS